MVHSPVGTGSIWSGRAEKQKAEVAEMADMVGTVARAAAVRGVDADRVGALETAGVVVVVHVIGAWLVDEMIDR